MIRVVNLGTSFDPGTLQLGTGQEFAVIVSKSVIASGSGISGSCRPAAAARFASAMLSLRCSGGSYLYTAKHAGSTGLLVTVRPYCKPGSVCPAWIARADLRITIG